MKIEHGRLYLADLSPGHGTEPGKLRPVVVIQSDLLNVTGHPSTWVLPCTTRRIGGKHFRLPLPANAAGNTRDCEVMLDQSRAIDNRRFRKALLPIPPTLLRELKDKLARLAEL